MAREDDCTTYRRKIVAKFQALIFGSMANYSFEAQISTDRGLKTISCLAVNSDILNYKDKSPTAVRSDKQMKHINTECVGGVGAGGGKVPSVLKLMQLVYTLK
jgi:hypothetical protein